LAASAITLAGCKIDNRPLLARGPGPQAAFGLPQPGPIDPYAAPAYPYGGQFTPASAYPYAERAYALDRAFYDTPPDYGFYYGDEEPWVWETADDSLMFAEPYGGAYRFYYYQPGDPYPYFVRDADYGYAYGPNGALIALFSAAGALLSADQYDRYYPQARQDWSRGYRMYQDYGRAPRQPVDPGAWRQRAPAVVYAQQGWIDAPASQPAWRQWRASRGGRAFVQRVDMARPARMARNAAGALDAPRPAFRTWNAKRASATTSPMLARQWTRPGVPAAGAHGREAPYRGLPAASARAATAEMATMRQAEARSAHAPPSARFAQQAARPAFQPHSPGGGDWRGAGAAPRPQAAPAHWVGRGPHGQGGGPPHANAGGGRGRNHGH
ncbi:MAG: hypothetical protein KGO51_09120, partial [Alphaproteobacteria bacterium]|nr:hypothetical protein [Alphaproteobacteria bacterium]